VTDVRAFDVGLFVIGRRGRHPSGCIQGTKMGDHERYFPIRNLKPGLKDLTMMFIVVEVKNSIKTKDGREVRTVRVADRSGSVNMSLWDDLGKIIQSGDIVKMTKGYCNVWKSCLTLNCSKISEFVKVGEFCYLFSEQPFLSEPNPDLQNPHAGGSGGPNQSGGPPNKSGRGGGPPGGPGGGGGGGNQPPGSYDPRTQGSRGARYNGGPGGGGGASYSGAQKWSHPQQQGGNLHPSAIRGSHGGKMSRPN